ncbi:MAG: hypothetical protein GEV08_25615, partial [Acidimicrobiia bacterium]|nr:hypothetical protein [Acidimicrobiia bacterium]
MSTTTRRRPTPTKRGRGRKPANRSHARRSPRAHARRAPRPRRRSGARAGAQLVALARDHGRDILSLSLLVLGVAVALGVYADAAGPLGNLLDTALGITVGLLRYVAPPVLAAAGVLMLGGEREDGGRSRVVLGVGALLVAVTGLLHVTRYDAAGEDPATALGRAGGAIGAGAGRALEAGAGVAGAVL